jgi:hypothetical protein
MTIFENRTSDSHWGLSSLLTPSQQLEPEVFLTFLPAFTEYRDKVASSKTLTDEDSNVLSSVNVLLD